MALSKHLRVAFVCITDDLRPLTRAFIGLAFVLACLPCGQKALTEGSKAIE